MSSRRVLPNNNARDENSLVSMSLTTIASFGLAFGLSRYTPHLLASTDFSRNHPTAVQGLGFLGHLWWLFCTTVLLRSLTQLKLPREGFCADTVQIIVKATILNPATYSFVFWLLGWTSWGQSLSQKYSWILWVTCSLTALAFFRSANGWLNRKVFNNFTEDGYDWANELVVVTGGSDGIGKHMVKLLAAKSIKVVVLDIQKPTYELPLTVSFLPCDLTSLSSLTSACSTLTGTHGPPTILILNAGIANYRTLLSTPAASLQKIFALNTLSHFHLAQAFLPHMIAQNHGMIVTIASAAAYVSSAGLVDYACTKASAVAFHEGLAAELVNVYEAPKVRTVLVAPSWAKSKLSEGLKGATGVGGWLSPLLEAETVAEAVVEKVLSGESGVIYLPRIHEWFAATVRAWPWWLQEGLRKGAKQALEILRERGIDLRVGEKGLEAVGVKRV